MYHVAFALVEEHGTLIECCLHLRAVEERHGCRSAGYCRRSSHRQLLILLSAGRTAYTYCSDNLAVDGNRHATLERREVVQRNHSCATFRNNFLESPGRLLEESRGTGLADRNIRASRERAVDPFQC